MSNDEVNEKLQALFVAYSKKLPSKIMDIEQKWLSLRNHSNQKQFQDFHRDVHSLCGSAGTYGYAELGRSARELEVYLKLLINSTVISPEQQSDITKLLIRLKEVFAESVPTKNTTRVVEHPSINKVVYILDSDEGFIQKISKDLRQAGYSSRRAPDVSILVRLIREDKPMALIVDVLSVNDDDMLVLFEIQKQLSIPLFCTATNIDMTTRLKAIRMGGQVFLHKPVDAFFLTNTLDQFVGLATIEPYRILIIDDSPSLAEYHSLILQEAGMITTFITNPLLLIDKMEEFQPDLLLMDIYMPECSGLELAAVLRQESQYTKIPIIFLSTEESRVKQLSALNLGGDDFLTKPILPQYLIEAVNLRAKRAGILSSFMMRDSLTGLLNHTNILRRLEVEMSRAKRQAESLSFIMIDIDHFKGINDAYGHPVGDKVIRSLSTLLLTSLRKTDIAGRYGGEEFAIILPNTNKENSVNVCDYLRNKFSQIRHEINGTKFSVTFSAGISGFPALDDAKTLIVSADLALYTAKKNGRNRIYYFDNDSNIEISR